MDGMGMELEYIKVYPASNPGWMGWMGWHALFYVPIYTPKCPLMGGVPLLVFVNDSAQKT